MTVIQQGEVQSASALHTWELLLAVVVLWGVQMYLSHLRSESERVARERESRAMRESVLETKECLAETLRACRSKWAYMAHSERESMKGHVQVWQMLQVGQDNQSRELRLLGQAQE